MFYISMNVKEFSLKLKGVSIVLECDGFGGNGMSGNGASAGGSHGHEMSGNGLDFISSDIK